LSEATNESAARPFSHRRRPHDNLFLTIVAARQPARAALLPSGASAPPRAYGCARAGTFTPLRHTPDARACSSLRLPVTRPITPTSRRTSLRVRIFVLHLGRRRSHVVERVLVLHGHRRVTLRAQARRRRGVCCRRCRRLRCGSRCLRRRGYRRRDGGGGGGSSRRAVRTNACGRRRRRRCLLGLLGLLGRRCCCSSRGRGRLGGRRRCGGRRRGRCRGCRLRLL
jgi:hypothetical protein